MIYKTLEVQSKLVQSCNVQRIKLKFITLTFLKLETKDLKVIFIR